MVMDRKSIQIYQQELIQREQYSLPFYHKSMCFLSHTYRITEDIHELLKSLVFPEGAARIFISGDILQRL